MKKVQLKPRLNSLRVILVLMSRWSKSSLRFVTDQRVSWSSGVLEVSHPLVYFNTQPDNITREYTLHLHLVESKQIVQVTKHNNYFCTWIATKY